MLTCLRVHGKQVVEVGCKPRQQAPELPTFCQLLQSSWTCPFQNFEDPFLFFFNKEIKIIVLLKMDLQSMFYCICCFGFSSCIFMLLCIDNLYSFLSVSSITPQSVDCQIIIGILLMESGLCSHFQYHAQLHLKSPWKKESYASLNSECWAKQCFYATKK